MKFPLTERLKKDLNKIGIVCILPVSYVAEFWVRLCEIMFCKKTEDK